MPSYEESRSPEWPAVEQSHLKKHPACAVCNRTGAVQVHHIIPVSYQDRIDRRDLELLEMNLVTLCESEHGTETDDHHELVGHLDDFKSYNPQVLMMVKSLRGKSAAEIRNDPGWQKARQNKPAEAANMTPADIAALKEQAETWYGPATARAAHGT